MALTQISSRYGLPRRVDPKSSRLFASRIEDWIAPATYDYAFSALNSLRYLRTHWALAAHFRNLALSMKPGALYAFNITLNDSPERPYGGGWAFSFRGKDHFAAWRWHSYSHVRRQIVEEVQLIEDGFVAPWATEYQLQAAVTTGSMRELLGQLPQWSVRDVYNHRFKRVEWPSTDSGTYWIVVELGH